MKYFTFILFLTSISIAQLVKPVNGDTLNYIYVCFEWNQLAGAVSYQIQIAENDTVEFQNSLIEQTDSTLILIIEDGIEWNKTYLWRIRGIDDDNNYGTWSENRTFHTLPLHPELSSFNISIYDSANVQPGMTIMDKLGSGLIYAINIYGNPVWFIDSNVEWDNEMDYKVQFTYFLENGNFIGLADGRENNKSGRVFEMTIDNDLAWQGPGDLEGIGVHHDVFPMPNGNIIALTSQDTLLPVPDEIELPETYSGIDALPWQGDRIVEWNRDGVEVWSWSVFSHFNFIDWNPNLYQDLLYTHPIPADFHYEWTHSNTVWYDPIDNAVYLSVRNMSRITKIDYDTGNIVWNMGSEMPSGDVTVGTDLGFSWQHSVKILDNQNLMMYDNGNENDPFYSRGLEISFTETDSISDTEIVWEYELPEDISSGLMSDCDRLSNGNSLLTSTTSNHILEVSPDSVKVWELLPFQEGSTFRSERIPGLYPQAFSVIQPDFIDEESGPTIYLPTGEATLEYEIHNEGWMNEIYEYNLSDDLGWFSESGTVEISPGEYTIIPMSGFISDIGIIDTLEFTVIPQHAPFRIKTYFLLLNTHLPPLEEITINYNTDWNLVGLPSEVEDPYYQTIFPTSVENTLYSFDVTYNLDSTLVPGRGYWLKFEEEGSTIITGNIIDEITLTLDEGWNLVSGPGNIVSIYSVTDPDGIIIPGTLYGFEYNYIPSEEFIPGKSYWLNTFQAGEITLTIGAVAKASQNSYSLKSKGNTLTINGIELYFGIELTDRERMSCSLPPKPPVGAFDARFTGDWKYCGEECLIEIMNNAQNLTLFYDIVLPLENKYNWVLLSEENEEYILDVSGKITVNISDRFTLVKKLISVPKTFTLYQNYPNPFNPYTTFKYDLPIRSHVILVIYDIIGEEITRLVNTTQDAGSKTIGWNSTDSFGNPVSAGVYFYQIKTGKFSHTRKMILLK